MQDCDDHDPIYVVATMLDPRYVLVLKSKQICKTIGKTKDKTGKTVLTTIDQGQLNYS